jgi:hypothetical protein
VGADPQEFVEMFAIDHANVTVFDRNIDVALRGRNHARGVDAGNDLAVRNVEILDQPRGDRATAGFDPPIAVNERD